MRYSFSIPLSLLLLACTVVSAQTGGASVASSNSGTMLPRSGSIYTLQRNVALLVLDGVAVDAQGNVVTDLTKSDFSIAENGVPQKIRGFDQSEKYVPPADVTVNSTADLNRRAPNAPVNIILLDEFGTRFEDIIYAKYSLKKWLGTQPARLSTPTMLIAVGMYKFTVLRDFTQDKSDIVTAINKHFALYPWYAQDGSWRESIYTNAQLALERVAEATAGHRGHKTIIWLGRGFSDTDRHINAALAPSGSLAGDTLDQLRDARVALYAIDPAGVQAFPYFSYGGYWSSFENSEFQAIAAASGGRTFTNRNDVDVEIATAAKDARSFYTLSYAPSDPDDNARTLRHIEVKIDRPGVKFISRTAYYPASRPPKSFQNGKPSERLRLELVSAGENNMQYDSIGFTAAASKSDVNDIHIHVDGKGVENYMPGGRGAFSSTRLIVFVTTFDKKNEPLQRDAEFYKFNLRADMNVPMKDHPQMDLTFKLPANPKAVRARFIVRVESSGRMGSADLPIVAGAMASSAVAQADSTPSDLVGPAHDVIAWSGSGKSLSAFPVR